MSEAPSTSPLPSPSEEQSEPEAVPDPHIPRGLGRIGRFQQTTEATKCMGLFRFEWFIVRRAFTGFEIWNDMWIGTAISLLNLLGLVYFGLITAEDWHEHESLWIFVMVAPYGIVLLAHAIWRLLCAPSRVYADLQMTLGAVQNELEALKCELRRRDEKGVLILLVSSMSREGEYLFHVNPDADAAQSDIDIWKNKLAAWQERTASVLPSIGRNKFEQLTDIKMENFPGAHESVWFELRALRARLQNLTEIMEKPKTYLVTFD
jgi:hypothetical protein